jgi:hypothetical protein
VITPTVVVGGGGVEDDVHQLANVEHFRAVLRL